MHRIKQGTHTSRAAIARQVNLFIREGEGLTVEFKERYTSRIDEDIVAFANAKGGTILLGVRENGTVVGETLTNDLKAKINSLARNLKPTIAADFVQVDKVVAVIVPEGTDKPYSCGSGYYRRLDGNTQKMSHDELRIMFAENEPLSFEERTVKSFTFDDISNAKIRAFTKEAGIQIGRTSVHDFLRSLNVADESRVKNAGILFFAKDVYKHIHQSQMTLVAFKGTERSHIYDRRDVRDDLLTQFNEAVAFLKRHLNIRSEIHGVNRKDIYEIPLEVLREAVVNSLMHRDYSIAGTQVSVEIYDDRVEIVNPGGLPKGMTVNKLGKVSIRRNELIADLFFRMDKVERMGMGIKKMKETMAEAGLHEPRFEPDTFFRATFPRSPELTLKKNRGRSVKRVGEKVGDGSEKRSEKNIADRLTENQRRILSYIRTAPYISARELSTKVGISARKVEQNIAKLKHMGVLRRIGPAKGGHWEIIL